MADTTSLNQLADCYPPLVGWCRCDDQCNTTVTLNGAHMSLNPAHFPLQARIRVYEQGKIIAETFSQEVLLYNFTIISLQDVLAGRLITNGYFEVTIFSRNEKWDERFFYSEVWASVYSQDGKIAVNYPMMMARGADPSMIDSSYLYYPGITSNEDFEPALVAINHHDFDNEYEVKLYDQAGEHEMGKKISIPKKSLHVHRLEELFNELPAFFSSGPGMLIFHFKYKMNSYVQTWHHRTSILSGMDHMGILFASGKNRQDKKEAVCSVRSANRMEDPMVCYCKSITAGQVCRWVAMGLKMGNIQKEYGAGTVCMGCVADLERLSGDNNQENKEWPLSL